MVLRPKKSQLALESSTEFDPSGPYNRRYLEETLGREVRRAARARQSLGFLMIDLDHFKRFNDTYGHVVLRDTGTGLGGRICDYFANRGFEFCERAGRALAFENAGTHDSAPWKIAGMVTISVGVAVFS